MFLKYIIFGMFKCTQLTVHKANSNFWYAAVVLLPKEVITFRL